MMMMNMRLIRHTLIRNVWLRSWILFISARVGGCWHIFVISDNGTPWKDALYQIDKKYFDKIYFKCSIIFFIDVIIIKTFKIENVYWIEIESEEYLLSVVGCDEGSSWEFLYS
jgi:hypothetical protein